jgi:hypothetical protein
MVSPDLRNTRSPKLIGDFGESLVTYALIQGGYEVAHVDHVGADLIAEKEGRRIAVSVKTRRWREGTRENDMVVVESANLEKLRGFAERFALEPVFAQVICHDKSAQILVFMIREADIADTLAKVKHGFSLPFGEKKLPEVLKNDAIRFSRWTRAQVSVV